MSTEKKTTSTASAANKAAAAKTHNPVEAAVAANKETVDTFMKAGSEVASQGVEKVVAMNQEQIAAAIKAGTDAFKGYEDMVTYNKANVDAVMKANQVMMKGVQDINKVLFGLAQSQLEDSVAVTKKILGCKSLKDVVEVQSDFAKANYKKSVDESRKLTDLSVKLAEEAAAPLTTQVNETVERFSKPLAA